MYMDEIQYTYKLCKLVLMKSIHEIDICILDKSKLKLVYMMNRKHNIYKNKFLNNMKIKYVWIESNTYCKL